MAHILAWGQEGAGQHILTDPQHVFSKQNKEIKHISTGVTHTLVCVNDGCVYSCGSNDFKQCGREGNIEKFEHVEGLQTHYAIQVATGASHSVVLTQAHKVLTWGKNTEGQLGRGDFSDSEQTRRMPALLNSLASYHVLQVACGNDHNLVLTNDGRVGVWGSDSYGQLGLGSSTGSKNNPTWLNSISGLPVAQIAAGGNHSFVLSKSGAIYGWGRNSSGQLGLNDTADSYSPKQCRALRNQKIKYICCGENHTACLSVDGRVFTFGDGTYGQLGHGSDNNEILPRQVMELTGSEVSQVACGRCHTLAYVPKTGRLYAFGLGKNGQLGLSTTDNENSPMSVPGQFTSETSQGSPMQGRNQKIRTIYAGGDHSFAVTQDEDGGKSDDFRLIDPTTQILTLSQDRIEVLQTLQKDDIPTDELTEEMTKIFSSAACLNGSFLLPNDDHYETTSKKHGVDINSLNAFFKGLKQIRNVAIINEISRSIEQKLIPSLPQSPPDVEALRVYLMLPECFVFDQPKLYTPIIVSFAKSFISLSEIALRICEKWWSSIQPTFFKRLVVTYKSCLEYLLPTSKQFSNLIEVLKAPDIFVSIKMLKKLHQVNEVHNQIIPYQEFYVSNLKDKITIRDDYIGWVQETNTLGKFGILNTQDFHFCNYPFLFDAAAKCVLLQTDAALQMQNAVESALCNLLLSSPLPLRQFDPYLVLSVQRDSVLHDTIAQLQTKSSAEFKKPIKIIFQGELDYDGQGVKKEFFHVLFREVMDPKYGMFEVNELSKLHWFNKSTQKEPNMFKLIGMLCGLAIYNGIIIPLHFPSALYKKLLKRAVTLDDVQELDPVFGKSLKNILNFDGDDDEFSAIFCLSFEEIQENKSIELCPGGKDRIVNKSNKHEYIDLIVDRFLNKSVELQFSAFNEGFHAVCGGQILELFQPQELQAMMVGSEDYDFNVFQENTDYIENYNSDHPTIKIFWEVFHEMSTDDKKKFLLFLTSSDRIPVFGMKHIKMKILPGERNESLLPVAYTCTNSLILPEYTSKETLKEKLLLAIKQTEGFGQVA